MRLVANTLEDYQTLVLLQKQITQLWKQEKEHQPNGILTKAYKTFMNTPIEKAYERPGDSMKKVNAKVILDTDDKALFIPYIVQAATIRKKMAIEYKDAKGNVSKRVIEPFTWRNNQVVAWCHERGAWRQFKPSQMIRVAIIDESFDRPEEVEIQLEDAKAYAHLIQ